MRKLLLLGIFATGSLTLAACEKQVVKEVEVPVEDTTEINRLKEELLIINAELAETKEEVIASNAHANVLRSQLKDALSTLTVEKAANKELVASLFDDIKLLELSNDILLEEKEALTFEVTTLKADLAKLDGQYIFLFGKYINANMQIDYLNAIINTLRYDKANLIDDNATLTTEKEALLKEVSELNKEISTLEADLELLNEQYTFLFGKYINANMQIDFLDATITTLRRDKTTLTSERDSFITKYMGSQEALIAVLKEHIIALDNIEVLEKEVASLKASLKNSDKTITDLQSKVESLETEKESVESELSDTKDLLNTANNTIDDLNSQIRDLEEAKKVLEAKVESTNSQLNDANATIKDLTSSKAYVESELRTATAKIRELESQIKDLKEAKATVESQLNTANATIKDLESKVAELEAKITNNTVRLVVNVNYRGIVCNNTNTSEQILREAIVYQVRTQLRLSSNTRITINGFTLTSNQNNHMNSMFASQTFQYNNLTAIVNGVTYNVTALLHTSSYLTIIA